MTLRETNRLLSDVSKVYDRLLHKIMVNYYIYEALETVTEDSLESVEAYVKDYIEASQVLTRRAIAYRRAATSLITATFSKENSLTVALVKEQLDILEQQVYDKDVAMFFVEFPTPQYKKQKPS